MQNMMQHAAYNTSIDRSFSTHMYVSITVFQRCDLKRAPGLYKFGMFSICETSCKL